MLDLIDRWSLNEETEGFALGRSGREHHGRVREVVWGGQDGRRAAFFDRKGATIDIAHFDALKITGDITIDTWV